MRLRPFSGLVPTSNDAATALVSPPCDCVCTAEARAHIAANPRSFLAVTRPDATAPPPAPHSSPCSFAAAAARDALAARVAAGDLAPTPAPTIFVYEQADPATPAPPQRGLVALVSVRDYDARVIRPHEKTRPGKVDDRVRLTDALSAHTSPVFLAYRDDRAVDDIVSRTVAAAEPTPQFDVSAADAVRHRVWPLAAADADAVVAAFHSRVPHAYIADGHHRAASAARVARARGSGGSGGSGGDHPAAWFLAVLFPATQLTCLPFHRVVRDLCGRSCADLLVGLGSAGAVEALARAPSRAPACAGDVCVFVGARWYRLRLGAAPAGAAPQERLDCGRLQDAVLAPMLGVLDPRTDERLVLVGGRTSVAELEEMVRAQGDGVAFLMCPVTVAQLMEVADAGALMPPKSTYFSPKLASGFFIQTF